MLFGAANSSALVILLEPVQRSQRPPCGYHEHVCENDHTRRRFACFRPTFSIGHYILSIYSPHENCDPVRGVGEWPRPHDPLSHDGDRWSRLSFIILFHRSSISISRHRTLPFIHATRARRPRPRRVAWASVLAAPRWLVSLGVTRDGRAADRPVSMVSLHGRPCDRMRRLCRRLISIRSALDRPAERRRPQPADRCLGKPGELSHSHRPRDVDSANGDRSASPRNPLKLQEPSAASTIILANVLEVDGNQQAYVGY